MAPELLRALEVHKLELQWAVRVRLTEADVDFLYQHHKGQPYYQRIVDFMCSGDSYSCCLIGPQSGAKEVQTFYRLLFTDPENAAANIIHVADADRAELEASHFFEKMACTFRPGTAGTTETPHSRATDTFSKPRTTGVLSSGRVTSHGAPFDGRSTRTGFTPDLTQR